MRAFVTVWRAVVSFYGELFPLLSLNIFWWLTGGVFVGLAALLTWAGMQTGDMRYLFMPLVAIPAGPATAALANIARPLARDLRIDSAFFWQGWRTYWRTALAVSAVSMVILSLLGLNFWFYWNRGGAWQIFSILWLYLTLLWFGAQTYLYPILVGLKQPTLLNTLRAAAVMAFANPLYTALLALLVVILTAISVALAILLPLAWPVVMVLLGEHSLLLFMQRLPPQKGETGPEE